VREGEGEGASVQKKEKKGELRGGRKLIYIIISDR
jgi:hypothetical protein